MNAQSIDLFLRNRKKFLLKHKVSEKLSKILMINNYFLQYFLQYNNYFLNRLF